MCKIVQHGDWAGILDYNEVPLLPAKKKRSTLKVLDVKPVQHGTKTKTPVGGRRNSVQS